MLAYPPQFGPNNNNITTVGPLRYDAWRFMTYPAIDRSGAGWPYETLIGIDNVSQRHLTFLHCFRRSSGAS